MFRFFESIAIVDGKPRNLYFHQTRVDKTFKHFFSKYESHHLEYLLTKIELKAAPLVKCKFSYDELTFKFYQLPYVSKVFKSFILIEDDTILYSYKFVDRSYIDKYLKNSSPDEQIIFIKNKVITDSSFSNLIFFDGYRWLTPARPLLLGTMRALLLAEWRIHEEHIGTNQLHLFKSFKLINALNSIEDSPEYPISLINPEIIKV